MQKFIKAAWKDRRKRMSFRKRRSAARLLLPIAFEFVRRVWRLCFVRGLFVWFRSSEFKLQLVLFSEFKDKLKFELWTPKCWIYFNIGWAFRRSISMGTRKGEAFPHSTAAEPHPVLTRYLALHILFYGHSIQTDFIVIGHNNNILLLPGVFCFPFIFSFREPETLT